MSCLFLVPVFYMYKGDELCFVIHFIIHEMEMLITKIDLVLLL